MLIRPTRATDLMSIQAIFAHEVENGFATFETLPPDLNAIGDKWRTLTDAGFPHVVCEVDRSVTGFAYAAPYRPRPAYDHTIENSVYVSPAYQGHGVGRELLNRLIAECQKAQWRQMIAVIGDSGNAASIALHASCGFKYIGTLEGVGYKFGRWVDTVIMQRKL